MTDTVDTAGAAGSGATRFHEPHGLLLTRADSTGAFADATSQRLEFSSRGDRVPCRLVLPASITASVPVVLLVGDAGAARDDACFDFAAEFAEQGIAVATLDLSLHGERTSPKFSERLFAALGGAAALDDNGHALVGEFAAQSTSDLLRCFDVLGRHESIDAQRMGMLGIGVGANLAARTAAGTDAVCTVALFERAAPVDPSLDVETDIAGLAKGIVTESAGKPDSGVCAAFARAFAKR
ncbi:MAG: hypothetical protein QF570_13665 [Myxococcota bacterium]|jgi:dienelactone hydrolase|nr:hypothetical protein [Myxococcota bacterium]